MQRNPAGPSRGPKKMGPWPKYSTRERGRGKAAGAEMFVGNPICIGPGTFTPALHKIRLPEIDLVGWVERSETHHPGRGLHSPVGFAALNPPYGNTARGPDKDPPVRVA
jgi:hypothetical protein